MIRGHSPDVKYVYARRYKLKVEMLQLGINEKTVSFQILDRESFSRLSKMLCTEATATSTQIIYFGDREIYFWSNIVAL